MHINDFIPSLAPIRAKAKKFFAPRQRDLSKPPADLRR